MKIGLCTIAYRNLDVCAVIPHAARIGFEEIEIIGKQVEDKSDAELDTIRDCAVDHGVEIAGVAPYFWFTQDEKLWRESMDIAERFTHIACRLGARMVRTFTDSGPTGIGSHAATEAQWATAVQSLQTITARAPDLIFSVETHEKTLADTPAACLRLRKCVGAENLLFTYQAFKGGEIIGDYEAIKPSVRQVHLNPHLGDHPHGDLGDCGVDYAALLQHLAATGYAHSVAVEFCKEGEASWERLERNHHWLREQILAPG
ncbi:sugar phosphate isomerase/epimerase family protein [Cerasicoccus frondis]|uniref:sugar phosphate isomerase/epimerase family protein n=1 Tax=Cerasicoccus frondis TaxID=490090 RepID=UPI002852AA36|nr:sugar phosphate isomerase/epimerase [Cerasicoccus frondis]